MGYGKTSEVSTQHGECGFCHIPFSALCADGLLLLKNHRRLFCNRRVTGVRHQQMNGVGGTAMVVRSKQVYQIFVQITKGLLSCNGISITLKEYSHGFQLLCKRTAPGKPRVLLNMCDDDTISFLDDCINFGNKVGRDSQYRKFHEVIMT